jgi:hypothetical protein
LKRQEIEETPEIITQALEEWSDYERVIAKETIKNLKETLWILRY